MDLIQAFEMIILAVFTAGLSLAFNMFLKPNMIFNWYAILLVKLEQTGKLGYKLAKPLGLCPYCHGTWVGIATYVYQYFSNFNLVYLFLFIGVNWLFIRIGYLCLLAEKSKK